MYCKLNLLILLLFFSTYLIGQNQMPTVIPSSPESKEFARYGDIPVSLYTGAPDISVPIYTVKIGKLSLPITLSYHATGIQVNQEATWVGLGWNLLVGGSISYIPVGTSDPITLQPAWDEFSKILTYASTYGKPFPTMRNEDNPACWSCVTVNTTASVQTAPMTFLLAGAGEQDVYSANFLNYSFKFVKHPNDGSYIFLGQKNKCKIEGGGTNGFVITGEDGTVYQFNSYESEGFYGILGWVLTKIVSSNGDEINLTYKSADAKYIPSLSEMYTIKGGVKTPLRQISAIPNSPTNLYLETIETRKERIEFDSNSREDILGGLKLSSITIKDKLNQSRFSYNFNYNYFIGSSDIGGDYLDGSSSSYNIYTSDLRKKRLQLLSLTQSNNTTENDKYVFSYYDQIPLPYKTSFAIDHWGYYNGQQNSSDIMNGWSNNRTIIPNPLTLLLANSTLSDEIPGELFSLHSAIRGTSSAYITAGMLKSIKYPTKGETVFEYEPHDFSNYKYISAEDETSNNVIINGSANVYAKYNFFYNRTSATFIINHRVSVNFTGYTHFNDGRFTIEAVSVPGGFNTITYQYSNQPPGSNGRIVEWNENFWLNPGEYRLTCNVPAWQTNNDYQVDFVDNNGSISYNDYNTNGYSNSNFIGGGVRIKQVTYKDNDNSTLYFKKYTYKNVDGKTSGRLMLPLINLDSKTIKVGSYENQVVSVIDKPTYILNGSSYVSLSSQPFGITVGYDRVIVETNNGENGKEVYNYNNASANLFDNKIPYFSEFANGDLKSKAVLNSSGDTLMVEKYNYAILSGTETTQYINAMVEDIYEGPTNICQGQSNPFANIVTPRFNIYTYPTRSYWNTLTRKETTHYFSGGKVKETADYTYSLDNFCVRSVTESTSKGVKYTNFKYPNDFSGTFPYSSMWNSKHMFDPIIEETTINGTATETLKTNYFNPSGSIYVPQTVQQTIGTDPTTTKLTYNSYDDMGNITQYTGSDGLVVTIVWGYSKTYPVAKIVSGSAFTLNSTIRDNINNHTFLGTDVKTQIDSDIAYLSGELSSYISSYHVYLYTYKPSAGMMTSQTEPNGKTTYYGYDIFERLKLVENADGNILNRYKYNYKP